MIDYDATVNQHTRDFIGCKTCIAAMSGRRLFVEGPRHIWGVRSRGESRTLRRAPGLPCALVQGLCLSGRRPWRGLCTSVLRGTR